MFAVNYSMPLPTGELSQEERRNFVQVTLPEKNGKLRKALENLLPPGTRIDRLEHSPTVTAYANTRALLEALPAELEGFTRGPVYSPNPDTRVVACSEEAAALPRRYQVWYQVVVPADEKGKAAATNLETIPARIAAMIAAARNHVSDAQVHFQAINGSGSVIVSANEPATLQLLPEEILGFRRDAPSDGSIPELQAASPSNMLQEGDACATAST